jgi:hypothetical protein
MGNSFSEPSPRLSRSFVTVGKSVRYQLTLEPEDGLPLAVRFEGLFTLAITV